MGAQRPEVGGRPDRDHELGAPLSEDYDLRDGSSDATAAANAVCFLPYVFWRAAGLIACARRHGRIDSEGRLLLTR